MAPHVADCLEGGTTISSASYVALHREYGGVAANPSLLVVDLPPGTAAEVRGWGIRRGWGSRGDLSPALAAVVG